MDNSTIAQLKELAPDLLQGKIPSPCPVTAQRAIALLEILKDGNWHTATEMGKRLGIAPKYVNDILRACSQSWALASSTKNGWMLVREDSVMIV
ncbi:hypothetical protein VF04_03990 [Nostoc linckia z7]|uniref:Helix-turn-helix domain-containing protein n=2 Tax=Nostoc linckia TaxID=92942 RepID=A0A9Q5ZGC8_NOSLI|nr:hypothetical protein [Nostoc linckia]PHK42878.1 hypothetical protein VF12_00690 [Nostoc linckia z15]PHK48035.1 hypothetical protein VF13_01665 [Nostoc linckia z16]PHJ64955.1 hypothetical protein VF02_11475 [Nostoc linckia z1]PHJ70133.1 hypothetical protein VF05_11635 [Nostoc linckia z3]PHJ75034.1 hypothetical protein VF03_11795 [Nostoc linckia z2]